MGTANGEVIGVNSYRIALNCHGPLPWLCGGPRPREKSRHSSEDADAWNPPEEHSPLPDFTTQTGRAVWRGSRGLVVGLARGLAEARGQLRKG